MQSKTMTFVNIYVCITSVETIQWEYYIPASAGLPATHQALEGGLDRTHRYPPPPRCISGTQRTQTERWSRILMNS